MKFQTVPANYSDEIPTFSKWAKTVTDETASIPKMVEVIWLPNLYNNYTLQTSSYRFRVPEGHPYYSVIVEYLEEWQKQGAVLFLTASGFPKAVLELEVIETSVADWEELGEAGFKILNVKAAKSPPSQKTRKQNSAKSGTALSVPQEGASS